MTPLSLCRVQLTSIDVPELLRHAPLPSRVSTRVGGVVILITRKREGDPAPKRGPGKRAARFSVVVEEGLRTLRGAEGGVSKSAATTARFARFVAEARQLKAPRVGLLLCEHCRSRYQRAEIPSGGERGFGSALGRARAPTLRLSAPLTTRTGHASSKMRSTSDGPFEVAESHCGSPGRRCSGEEANRSSSDELSQMDAAEENEGLIWQASRRWAYGRRWSL